MGFMGGRRRIPWRVGCKGCVRFASLHSWEGRMECWRAERQTRRAGRQTIYLLEVD
jgi:hypothetical protein